MPPIFDRKMGGGCKPDEISAFCALQFVHFGQGGGAKTILGRRGSTALPGGTGGKAKV
jgi:hypothetical protein